LASAPGQSLHATSDSGEDRLETALVYEAVFRTPVRELFAGIYEKAERSAARRARLLRKRLLAGGRCTQPKLKLLDALAPERLATKPRFHRRTKSAC
jgi:hypothetical protein